MQKVRSLTQKMNNQDLYNKTVFYLNTLCADIPERCVGSEGNRAATAFFKDTLTGLGWATETPEFNAIDWIDGGATLMAGGQKFKVLVSPYSLGCNESARLAVARNLAELKHGDFRDKILLLTGDIAKEQLMPKGFVFYNPEEHQEIIALLESTGVKAIISATGRDAALAGGVYPFPLIEDGDFDIPSVYMTEEEGQLLLPYIGKEVHLQSISERVPGSGCNVIGTKGCNRANRVVVTAHIDAKKGTPGAIDNASGIAVLLVLAELLKGYSGPWQIELVALNGEDYFAVPGQMNYVMANQGKFESILLNINIDGAGYFEGKSAFSFYDLPEAIHARVLETLAKYPGIKEGIQWPQGDHSIFIQYGRPAIAVSSDWFTENINNQDITHTPKDNLNIIDYNRIVEIAEALHDLTSNF
jgi:aminopeptidase YwaD